MNKSNKVYSIQKTKDRVRLAETEIVILNGLYKFSILGTNQKNISDVKDRVYSALRYQKLHNLKSGNKKITVNILPNNTDYIDNIYDLSIAMSYLASINQINLTENIVALGELSISGKIISSNNILKALFLSLKENIKHIICTRTDIDIIYRLDSKIFSLIKDNGIKFTVGDNLGEVINNIQNSVYHEFQKEIVNYSTGIKDFVEIKDSNIFKIILGLCTNRNILIEKQGDLYLLNFLNNLIFYSEKIDIENILELSSYINEDDLKILDNYYLPYVLKIDSQISEKDIINNLKYSAYGFNIIDNILEINKDTLTVIKNNHRSSIICFYSPCLCGNSNIFFNSNVKCFCLQRHILKYRNKVMIAENNYFDFYINTYNISNTSSKVTYKDTDYINLNRFILKFKNTNFLIDIKDINKINDYIKYHTKDDGFLYKKVFELSIDIEKYKIIYKNNSPKTVVIDDISNQTIDIALELIKKGF